MFMLEESLSVTIVRHYDLIKYVFLSIIQYNNEQYVCMTCCRTYLMSWLSTVAPAVLLDLPLCYVVELTSSHS